MFIGRPPNLVLLLAAFLLTYFITFRNRLYPLFNSFGVEYGKSTGN